MEENKKKTAQDANQRVSMSTPNNENGRGEEVKNTNKKRKLIIGGAAIGAIIISALAGGYYYSTSSIRNGAGFDGVVQISDSMNVKVDSADVSFNLSTATAVSSPVSTQSPIANITDFHRALGKNVSDARKNGDGSILIPSIGAMFAINTNIFVGDGEEVVNAFADTYLKTNKTAMIDIEGYTCDLGEDRINTELSKLRAETAKSVLVEAGVPSDKIEIKWYGKTRNKEFSYKDISEYRRVIVSIK